MYEAVMQSPQVGQAQGALQEEEGGDVGPGHSEVEDGRGQVVLITSPPR